MHDPRTLHAEILEACLVPYQGQFANGEHANNKLDMERLLLPEHEDLKYRVVQGLGERALRYGAEFVTAVPNGANWIAQEVSDELSIDMVELRKNQDTGEIGFASEEDRETALAYAKGGILFEDVVNRLTSANKVLRMFELNGRLNRIIAIWDRGPRLDRTPPRRVPLTSLFTVHIPAELPDDSYLWKYMNA